MKTRKVKKSVRGQSTVDGAGVNLIRVLGDRTVEDFDPFLMLDSFDSYDPDDYTAGFPMHPHRGIETITYLLAGEIDHEDSLGNKGVIHADESQWMTAGSGIMHQEMPQAAPRMLGLQIWLNLPQKEKMTDPAYFDIKKDMMRDVPEEFGIVRVIAGEYKGEKGVKPPHWPATLYDVTVDAGHTATIPTNADENVFVFLILGDAEIGGKKYDEKTAVLFGEGDAIEVTALKAPCRFIFFAGRKLEEPVAWGGPIVMNTEDELIATFHELRDGTFIKKNAGHAS